MKLIQDWRRKKDEKSYAYKQMHHEYRSIYVKMSSYLNVKGINEIAYQEILDEIMSMCIEGETRKIPIEEIFGSDYKLFCDEISKNAIRKSIVEKIVYYLNFIMILSLLYFLIALFYQLIGLMDGSFIDAYHVQITYKDYGLLSNSLIIAFLTSSLLPHFQFNKTLRVKIIIGIFIILYFALSIMFINYKLPKLIIVPYALILCILISCTGFVSIVNKALIKKYYFANKKSISL